MANSHRKVPQSVAGEFFVDTTCIDCDACRELAPAVFAEAGEFSYVRRQPQTEAETRAALRALLCCPVGAIGTRHANAAKRVMGDFPMCLEEPVFYCGFNFAKSFGGSSYFIADPAGNWLVDAPKFLPRLVRWFEERGGLRYIFLTHRDDVAEAPRYAEHFGAARIVHAADAEAVPGAEILIEGTAAIEIQPRFKIIPTPGHTRGHCVMLLDNRFLFSGDHLWWDADEDGLGASRNVCWYSWREQSDSISRLLEERFEWVLPGHGDRHREPAATMHRALEALVARTRT